MAPPDADLAHPRPSRDSHRTLAGIRARHVAFLLVSIGYAAWAVYDLFVDTGFTVGTWLAHPLDWLFGYAMLVFGFFVAVPMATDHERRRRYRRAIGRQLETRVAVGVLVVFAIVGLVGPHLVGQPGLDLYHKYQPPVWGSMPADYVVECAGPMVDGTCQGSWQFPLGTDRFGTGTITLLVAGANVSLYVAAIAAMLIVPVAVAAGAVAGFYGGLVDRALTSYMELQDVLPALVVYMLVLPATGESLFVVVVIFGFFSWGSVARIVRSEVTAAAAAPYVEAAENLGTRRPRILRRHVLPNVSNSVVTALAHHVPLLLLTEAGIAFLGFESADVESFGRIIARGLVQEQARTPTFPEKWWVATFAALSLAAIVAAFKLVGDALRDAEDPRALDR